MSNDTTDTPACDCDALRARVAELLRVQAAYTKLRNDKRLWLAGVALNGAMFNARNQVVVPERCVEAADAVLAELENNEDTKC